MYIFSTGIAISVRTAMVFSPTCWAYSRIVEQLYKNPYQKFIYNTLWYQYSAFPVCKEPFAGSFACCNCSQPVVDSPLYFNCTEFLVFFSCHLQTSSKMGFYFSFFNRMKALFQIATYSKSQGVGMEWPPTIFHMFIQSQTHRHVLIASYVKTLLS